MLLSPGFLGTNTPSVNSDEPVSVFPAAHSSVSFLGIAQSFPNHTTDNYKMTTAVIFALGFNNTVVKASSLRMITLLL